MDTPPRPAVPQPPTPYLQRTSWKGGWFFLAGPGMENVAPLVESFYSLTRQNQERFAGRALSAPSPACAGGPEAFPAQHPSAFPGVLAQGAREGAGWACMAAAQGQGPAFSTDQGRGFKSWAPAPELWDPLPNISPAPPHRGVQLVRGGGDPCPGLCSAPEGTQGTGCERHPEAFHGDPVFPGAPLGANARNFSGGGYDASEPNPHLRADGGGPEGGGRRGAGGGPAPRSVPGGAWPCAHRRGARVRGRAARGAWDPCITAPARLREPRGQGWLLSATSARPQPYRGQLKLNETHRPGARSSAHGHALVRAPAPLPSRPLRCVRGGGHSLRRLVRAGKSRVGRQAWTLVWASGDRLPWKPSRPCPAERSRTPPPPPEEACGTDFSPRAWGHRRWPWGQHVRCSGPCGPVPFPEAGAVRGQRCSFLRIDTECPIHAPLSPTQAAGLQPPARCFEPSARPAPALSLCPPLAPHLALHAFGLGETPLCGLILHRRDSPTAQGLAVQWR